MSNQNFNCRADRCVMIFVSHNRHVSQKEIYMLTILCKKVMYTVNSELDDYNGKNVCLFLLQNGIEKNSCQIK